MVSRGDTEAKIILGSERFRSRHFPFREARSYLGQATLNLIEKACKETNGKRTVTRAAEERAKRAKERRKRAIVQQEVEVAKKRRHLNLSCDGVADIHFSETSTSTSTGKVEEYARNLSFWK